MPLRLCKAKVQVAGPLITALFTHPNNGIVALSFTVLGLQ